MIDFLKPNKSKLKLSLLIFALCFVAYVFQAVAHGYLKQRSSKEFENVLASPKYSELKQSLEKLAETKPVKGSDISSLHFKYLILDVTVSFVFTALLSYLGACFIYRKWNLLSS